jgi:hypothetical protein
MTLLITTRQTEERGNGTQRNFYFDFPVQNADELFVYILTDGNEEAVLREDYNITGLGNENGGSIYFNAGLPPSAAQVVHIQRWVENTQETEYVENDPFPADAHEDTLDRIVMMIQQTLQFEGVGQPGHMLMWDTDGTTLINGPDGDDIANAEEHAAEATASWLLALEAARAAADFAGGALNTNFTYGGKTSKSAYHYATLAMVYTIFPVNTVCWFGQTTAPIGWTIQPQFTDCLIGVKSETPGNDWYVAADPWTQVLPGGAPDIFKATSINALGDVMLTAGEGSRMYVSTNFGVNWSEIQPAGNEDYDWIDVDISATGANMIACVAYGRLYTSSDYGAHWIERMPDGNYDKDWRSVACDSTGTHMYACIYGDKVFHSSNSGVDWEQVYPKGSYAASNWQSISCSGDGSKVIIVEYNGRVFHSNNYGSTWEVKQPYGFSVYTTWYKADYSRDGTTIILCVSGGDVFLSTNSGDTWARKYPAGASSKQWQGVAVSSNGYTMVASIYNGGIYKSIDGGWTWVLDPNMISRKYNNIEMNDVGDRMIIGYGVADSEGGVYVYAPTTAIGTMAGTWTQTTHTHTQPTHTHTGGTISSTLPTHNHKWMDADGRTTYNTTGSGIDINSAMSGNISQGMIVEVTKANSKTNAADLYTSSAAGAGGTATGSTGAGGGDTTGASGPANTYRPLACLGIIAKLTTIPTV